jgi:molybdopterin converting factor small subunit
MTTVRFFAYVQDITGTREAAFDCSSVAALVVLLEQRYGPELARCLASSRLWVNGQPVGSDEAWVLLPDDEVAILPPVSGG